MGPGNLLVHFGHHGAGGFQRRDQVVGRQPQAVFAAPVGRAHLHQDDVGTDRARANQRPKPRIGRGLDLQGAGIGERAVMADAAIRGQPQMVRMPGLHDPRVVDAEKQAGTGKGRALRDQGLHQRLRLGAGLAADDSVAGSNYTSEIDHRSDYD